MENNRNIRRAVNYKLLINAGYDSFSATRYKNFGSKTVEKLCDLGIQYKDQLESLQSEWLKMVKDIITGKIK